MAEGPIQQNQPCVAMLRKQEELNKLKLSAHDVQVKLQQTAEYKQCDAEIKRMAPPMKVEPEQKARESSWLESARDIITKFAFGQSALEKAAKN